MHVFEFRLHSEGSNMRPQWGIALRHADDVPEIFDTDPDKRPTTVQIEFPDSRVHTFGIRPSFWDGCHEFVDSQVLEGTKPVKAYAIDHLGYSVKTKGDCVIEVELVKRNELLKIAKFE